MSPSNEESCLSDDERRVIKLCRQKTAKLSLDDARILVRLSVKGADFQDALKGNLELRSSILKRLAATQSVIDWKDWGPSTRSTYDAAAPLRQRWRSPKSEPQFIEYASNVNTAVISSLIKSANDCDTDAGTALRRLASDLKKAGRPIPPTLNAFAVQPKRRRGKRGPDPTSRHLLRVLIFDLLLELRRRGISPTQSGALIIADELGWSADHVVDIWKKGPRALRNRSTDMQVIEIAPKTS